MDLTFESDARRQKKQQKCAAAEPSTAPVSPSGDKRACVFPAPDTVGTPRTSWRTKVDPKKSLGKVDRAATPLRWNTRNSKQPGNVVYIHNDHKLSAGQAPLSGSLGQWMIYLGVWTLLIFGAALAAVTYTQWMFSSAHQNGDDVMEPEQEAEQEEEASNNDEPLNDGTSFLLWLDYLLRTLNLAQAFKDAFSKR